MNLTGKDKYKGGKLITYKTKIIKIIITRVIS